MSNTLLDIISENFSKSKGLIEKEFKEHLNHLDLEDDYYKEIDQQFKTKTKLIFDIEKDGNSFLDFVTKVYGKSNIASFHYIEFEKRKQKDINDGYNEYEEAKSRQLIYLNGKLELLNKNFNFKKNNLFTYGNYENIAESDYKFTSFQAQNSKILICILDDGAYGIFNSHGEDRAIFKIQKDFFKNPILEIWEGNRDEEEDETINEENVQEILKELNPRKGYVKEFKIYQFEN